MEPINTLVNAYIGFVSQSIMGNYRQNTNLDLTPVSIQYKNTEINFQHQMWRIRDKSICDDLKQDSAIYSDCTIKAKSLFNEICNALTSKSNKRVRESQYQRMYCNAAIKYKPMVATISSSETVKNKALEKLCNQLILKAMNTRDEKLKAERDRVCELAKG